MFLGKLRIIPMIVILSMLVGFAGYFAASPAQAAVIWAKTSSKYFTSIAYGNGMYVAFQEAGKVYTSANLTEWTQTDISSVSTKRIYFVKFENGKFMAGASRDDLAAGAQFLYSDDGIHWTGSPGLNRPSYGFSSVAYGGGVLRLTSENGGGILGSSDNGVNWTDSVSGPRYYEIIYMNDRFLAAGRDSSYAKGSFRRSSDATGTVWDDSYVVPTPIFSLATNGSQVVAVGSGGKVYRTDPAASPHLPTLEAVTPDSVTVDLNSVAYGSVDGAGLYAAVGNQGKVIISGDGNNWVEEASGITGNFSRVIYAEGAFVAVSTSGVFKRINAEPPTVTTTDVHSIGYDAAAVDAAVTSDNGLPVTEYGVVYATSPNPTLNNASKYNATLSGATYQAQLSGLIPNTTYYVRAYATNGGGTGYGEEISFATLNPVPTDLTLSHNTIAENLPAGTTVGTLQAVTGYAQDIMTYSLVSGQGDTNNTSFTIAGNTLKSAASFNYEAQDAYSIRVKAADSNGDIFEKSFTIAVTDVNEAPVVHSFDKEGAEDTPLAFTASDFDSRMTDEDQDILAHIRLDSLPDASAGTLRVDMQDAEIGDEIAATELGQLVFFPADNFYGTASFTWSGSDGTLYSAQPATVTMLVYSEFDQPHISDVHKTGSEDSPIAFSSSDFTAQYIDGDGDAMHGITIATLPLNGTLLKGTGPVTVTQYVYADELDQLQFVPDADWHGTSSFRWTASDGLLISGEASVHLEVSAVNDVPVAHDKVSAPLIVSNDTAASSVLSATDVDGDALSYIIVTPPSKGTVTQSVYDGGSTFSYMPHPGARGSDSFTFKANDGQADSNAATVLVHIVPAGYLDLGNLTISTGTLTPSFDRNHDTYEVKVNYGITNLTVSAAVYESDYAVLHINGADTSESSVALKVGNNPITLQVVARHDPSLSKTYTIHALRREDDSSSPEAAPSAPAAEQGNKIEVIVGGQRQEQSATMTVAKQGDKTVATVQVDNDKVLESMRRNNTNVVTIPVPAEADIVIGELNGQLVKSMEGRAAAIEIRTERATYMLPASQMQIDNIASRLGTKASLSDIKISIAIANSPEEKVQLVESAARNGDMALVVPPVDFEVTASYDGKEVEVSRFDSFVERSILLPEGIDPGRVTTGVVLNADGSVSHVPTKIIMRDGKSYALIQSLTNSTYSVVWNPKNFTDVANHWSKTDVNDMASRLVLQGVTDATFEPDRFITRAEFAAIIVRALGLQQAQTGTLEGFKDVASNDWFAPAVGIAAEYGLVKGYADGTFQPNGQLTRAEAIVIMTRALKLSGIDTLPTGVETSTLLNQFADRGEIGNWAALSAAVVVKHGIVKGFDGKLSPVSPITRAETAAMVKRMLQTSGLID